MSTIEMNLGNPFVQAQAPKDAVKPKKKSELWLNVGIEVPSMDEEGNKTVEFISLPYGIPLSTMPEQKVNSSNPRMRGIQQGGNSLLANLIEEGMKLDQGTDVSVNLVVKLRRANAEQPSQLSETDPISTAMSNLKLVG